ncbi:hypothetical protein [Enterococcus phage MDA1]|uniref:Uncharacterized protein n=1 Tax=Enterococcus phage MDA1 TaxID=2816460 RepID=A0AAE7RAM0_9CAUD|nr:hypothetical protein PQD11_gp25 [Enterococcus phage MDA1]QTZ83063.1 hypothetical protein [Enterococcus phage MDA1]
MKKLKLGDKVICTRDARKRWWKKGKIYEVVKSKNTNELVVLDDEEDEREIRIVEHYLNNDLKLKFELFKEENNMQEFKVGDLVEVIKNSMYARNEFDEYYKKGDKAIVTGVGEVYVHLGDNMTANLVKRGDIKKVEQSPELTVYEEELVLRLAEAINRKNNYLTELENLKYKLNEMEENYEEVSKEIKEVSKEVKEITKKLLTK